MKRGLHPHQVTVAVKASVPSLSQRLGEMVRQIESYQSQLSEQGRNLEETRMELRQSYTRYAELYHLAPVGFLTLDIKGRIRELNERAARLLGFPAAWLVEKPFVVFVGNGDVQRFLTFLTQSLRKPEERTIELALLVGGRNLSVQISTMTSMHDGAPTHRMTMVDLTDVKKTEKQLQESLDNWRSLVNNAPEVIMTLEGRGRIVFVNRPVWGCSVQALLGTDIVDYVPEKERVKLRRCLDSALKSALPTACEIAGVNGDPESWFSFSFGPVRTRDGERTAVKKSTTLIIREISEGKRTEKTLRTSGEQLREFAARVEAVREEERTRVAREIHDELGQALTILKLDLSWLQSKTPRSQAEARKKMNAMMQYVDATIESVRRIASELRPSILDDLGLIPAIEWQLSEFQKRTGIRSDFRSNAEKLSLPPEHAGTIFRVVQEALTNVMRHAKASKVAVSLNAEGHFLAISIRDNGRGVTESQINNMRSLGIVGMKERISRAGGEFNIHSRPGKGTRLDITLPTK